MRLALMLGLVLVLVAMLARTANADRNGFRAAVSYWAMRHTFFDHGANRYHELEGQPATARAWPYSQALSATIAMTAVPNRGHLYLRDAERQLAGLSLFLRADGSYAPAPGPSGPVFYDDNEWIGLDLMHWYHLQKDARAVARAQRLFAIVVDGWDSNPNHPCPGGIFWTRMRGDLDRNTVSTATAALLGLELYEVTHRPGQLAWSKQMLSWVMQCLLAPDGLLWDHIAIDGTVDHTHWSYNQGTAIGASVLLYRLTGDATALQHAEALADASLAYFDRTPGGREPPYYLAIFFRNLLDLAAVDGRADYRLEAQEWADSCWDQLHDGKTGLFRFRRSRPVELLEQAAMVQIYAMLAAPA